MKNNIHYKYYNLSNDYFRLQHEYNIYDEDNLIYRYLFNKHTYYNENLDPILYTNDDFLISFKKIIKMILLLHRHNRHGRGDINLEIEDNDNFINMFYLDRNNKTYLKNIYNISLYDEKLKSILKMYFMKKYLMLMLL